MENEDKCLERCAGEEYESCGNDNYFVVYQTQIQGEDGVTADHWGDNESTFLVLVMPKRAQTPKRCPKFNKLVKNILSCFVVFLQHQAVNKG